MNSGLGLHTQYSPGAALFVDAEAARTLNPLAAIRWKAGTFSTRKEPGWLEEETEGSLGHFPPLVFPAPAVGTHRYQ